VACGTNSPGENLDARSAPPVKTREGFHQQKCRRTREAPKVPAVGTAWEGYTAIEARMGKPGTIAKLESTVLSENHAPGRPETATYPWGVLSGIVLGARESRVHGEGPDGSMQSAKETRAGQVGLGQHEPTSLRATALGQRAYAQASTTEELDAGKLHVRVCAGGAG
jgi:hypothetical protein